MSSLTAFKARFLSGPEYIYALHEPDDHVAVLLRNRVRQQTIQRILTAETIVSISFQTWLTEQNLNGADIFIGMNPVTERARHRTKENIREIRHAYLDLDEEAGASLQAIRTTGDVPAPNFVLDTSPGKHQVVWRVEGFDAEQAESLLRALASQFGGDSAATDISRLLRVPGFLNKKYNEAFVVRVHHEADAIYHLQDFRVHEDSPESPRNLGDSQQGTRRIPTGHRSQSEADWAYAKRALARGDDPETVIERIADYRAQDKADPQYYARHTVTKALAESRGFPVPAPNDSRTLIASDTRQEKDR